MEPKVFAVRLDRLFSEAELARWLPYTDRARYSRLASGKRDASLAGELLARYAAWKEFGADPLRLRISRAGQGKPFFVNRPEIHWNISHSGQWCACAVHDAPVGIDVQRFQAVRFDAIARRYFLPEDQEAYRQAPDTQREFYRLWTKREALGKYFGAGLRELPEQAAKGCRFWWSWKLEGYALCVCARDRS